MGHLALVCVGLGIGFYLGVLTMALVAASDRDKLPEPRPVRWHAVPASSSEVSEPSWAGIGGHRGSGAIRGVIEAPLWSPAQGRGSTPDP